MNSNEDIKIKYIKLRKDYDVVVKENIDLKNEVKKLNNLLTISNRKIQKLEDKLEKIEPFIKELKIKVIGLDVVHWDDTTVKIQKDEEKEESKTKQGIVRFYGNDKYCLLTCVHDHVLLNYNDKYKFKNAECNVYILRYLK